MKFLALAILAILPIIFIPPAQAHGDEIQPASPNISYLLLSIAVISVFLLASFLKKNKTEAQKTALFLGIIVPSIIATVMIAASTILLNVNSVSGGPVHWHADFEIWKCDQRLELMKPEGLLNRIGSPVLHGHGDDRIHIEGVVSDMEDISFHSFMEGVGGSVGPGFLYVPTENGMVEMADGQDCNGQPSKVQAFLYRTIGNKVVRQKLSDPGEYTPATYSQVPPGDCLILELSPEKLRTDHICTTYRLAIQDRKLTEEPHE